MFRAVLAFGPSLLLAAGVPAGLPVVPEDKTSLYLVVIAGMLPASIGLVVSLVQWLGKRTVEREDQDKKEVRERLKEHDGRFERLERSAEELKASIDRRFGEMDHALVATEGEVKHVLSVVESIRGAVVELKSGLETRFEKQADFYRSSLKDQTVHFGERIDKLEEDLRHAVADSIGRGKRR